MTSKAKDADWAKIEADYRAGIKSNVVVAKEHGITETAIRKRAKREGWIKDLSAQIKAKADSLVRAQVVRDQIRTTNAISEKEIIDVNAQMQTNIIVAHRSDIQRNRALAQKLLSEIELVTDNKELFENLGEILFQPDKNGTDKLNEIYQKVIQMPSRIDSAKKLAETLKVLIGLEREVFGIDQRANTGTTLEDLLEKIDGGN